jgi:hypothetical protein
VALRRLAWYMMRVRLATWNCQTGLGSNWNTLAGLHVDVISIQECASETPTQAQAHGWECAYQGGALRQGGRRPRSITVQDRGAGTAYGIRRLDGDLRK